MHVSHKEGTADHVTFDLEPLWQSWSNEESAWLPRQVTVNEPPSVPKSPTPVSTALEEPTSNAWL